MAAATITRADRYAQGVKLDRAAMKIRDELRRGRPRKTRLRAEFRHARRALDVLESS